MDTEPMDEIKTFPKVQKIGSELFIYRDDLYPELGGGNKARKMMALRPSLENGRYTALVTTGGIQSNHCRATALYCQKFGLKCTLVIHGKKEVFQAQLGNAKLIRDSGAKLIFCSPGEISDTMDTAMSQYRHQGDLPFYLYGGGHTLEGGKAYIDAIEKLFGSGTQVDRIFLPSGTGSTHAGILAGISKLGLDTQVIGISVGRTKERGEAIIGEFYQKLCSTYQIPPLGKVLLDDRFLCGGYQKFNMEIATLSKNSLANYNVILDTTYTGKAFHGMLGYFKEQSPKGSSLFWYTGGIYNYFAQ